jgi:hypothetical protein
MRKLKHIISTCFLKPRFCGSNAAVPRGARGDYGEAENWLATVLFRLILYLLYLRLYMI